MIDTDAYEDITPERWAVDEDDPCRVYIVDMECTVARTDFMNCVIEEERELQLTSARLIADAPLLLAEVKQLRAEVKQLREVNKQYFVQLSNAFDQLNAINRGD